MNDICIYAIDAQYGFSKLAWYNEMIAMVKAGASLSEIGFSEMREKTAPVVVAQQANPIRVKSRWSLSQDSYPENSVAVMSLSGVIRSEGGACSYGVNDQVEWLHAIYSNPSIVGILLEIDSGGGDLIASQKLKGALEMRNKPIVSYVHMAASGGYMAAAATDEIWAAGPSSEFGSIGVMAAFSRSALEEIGKDKLVIVGKDSPEKNKTFFDLTEGKTDGLQANIDLHTKIFHDFIKSSRNLKGDVKDTLSGKMFATREAKANGLADGMTNFNKAMGRVLRLAKNYSDV